MALTINSTPANIDNTAAFNVTTDKTESGTYVNLRIRATIYHAGTAKAIVEQPKGLPAFDFAEILKSLVGGINLARNAGNEIYGGEITALATHSPWSSDVGAWDTLTIASNVISSAIESSTDEVFAKTANISVTVGYIYQLVFSAYTTSGANTPYIKLIGTGSEIGQTIINQITNGGCVLVMPIATGTFKVQFGHLTGQVTAAITLDVNEITTAATRKPLAPYFVTFIEVYEDASGVTQTSATATTVVFRYVPGKGDTNAFSKYVLSVNTDLFANKTFQDNVCKFFTVAPNEVWVMFFTEAAAVRLYYSKDGGGYSNTSSGGNVAEGWGIVCLNATDTVMTTVASNLRIYITNYYTTTTISAVLTINIDATQLDERVVLEFIGLVGGTEYLAFEGLKDISFFTERDYYKSSTRNRKPLSLKGINRQSIETRFKDINNTSYLKSLMAADDVKKLEASYAAPTEVTIVNDSVKISGSDMFTNRLDIEYEY